PVRLKNTEPRARVPIPGTRHDCRRKVAVDPATFPRQPEPRPTRTLIPDHHVEVAVVIHVEKPHAVVATVRRTQRLTAQQILIDPLLRLAEGQELDLLSVLRLRIVDQFDDLLILDPAVRMKDQAEDALLD